MAKRYVEGSSRGGAGPVRRAPGRRPPRRGDGPDRWDPARRADARDDRDVVEERAEAGWQTLGDYAQPTWGRRGHEEDAESWGDEWGRGYGGSRRYEGGYGFERDGDERFQARWDEDVERSRRGRHRGGAIGAGPGWGGGHAGRGPRGYRRSDERIREDVCDRLTDDDRVDATDVEVRVEEGVVVLTGTVDDRSQKRAAEDAAERAVGVLDVRNELRLRHLTSMVAADRTSGGPAHRDDGDERRGAAPGRDGGVPVEHGHG